jgi:predicted nucleotidyltransferase
MQVELLALILLQPDREWTLEELTGRLGAPQSSVHRELTRLVHAGLARRDARKRPHGFRAARENPAYEPLRDLVELTAGVPLRLSRALSEVPGVLAASIHGSWASGRIRPESDLDVVVVVEGSPQAVKRALRGVGKQIGRDVDASILSPAAFADLSRKRNPFLTKILRGPRIDLVGDLTVLGDRA